ncbi:MAG: cupin domain-containing protein [Balneolaceae bacterium]
MSRIKRLVDKLDLEPHPEGGYFKEMYRSDEKIEGEGEFPAGRSFGTSIYFLLEGTDRSKFHRIKSDEIWHFYEGSSATIHIIHSDGFYETLYLGSDLDSGYQFQHVVPAHSWFGVSVDQPDGYLLAGCTVAPGFDFGDFEMGDAYKLKQAFPEHESIIEKLT